jgi:tetratricopeptide (TPR) repeat protein
MTAEAKNKKNYALYNKGLEALQLGNYNRVLKIANKLHEVHFSGAFELEARARYEMGDVQQATQVLEMGLRKTPGVYILASYLGEYQSNQGHYQLAIEAFDRARNGEQDIDSFADLNISICYGRMEMYDRAAEYMLKAKFSPGYHGWMYYWLSKAKLEWNLGNHDQFLKDCEEGIALANREQRLQVKKQVAWIYAYRAEYHAKDGKRATAEQDLKAAKALHSHNEQYLRAFRILYGERLTSATRYLVVLEGTCENAPGLPKKMGMFKTFEIIAESEADLVPLAQLHAEPWQRWERVTSIKSETPICDVHKGVSWIAEGLTLYGGFGWLERLKSRLLGGRISNLE